jgi:hypothetical protein
MAETTGERSIAGLLRDLTDNVTGLVRDEFNLARAETSEKLNQATNALIALASGFLLGFAALIVLLEAVVLGLSNHMAAWLASLIVGAVVALVGLALVARGKANLDASRLAPNRTMKNIQRDAELAQGDAR